MRGLFPDERAVLVHLAGSDGLHKLADDDEAGEEIRDRLASQGRVKRTVGPCIDPPPGEDPNDWESVSWEITDLGRLALKVCTR